MAVCGIIIYVCTTICPQVVAVAARSLARAQEFAQKHDIPRAYGSYDELANDPEIGAYSCDRFPTFASF